MVVYIYRKLHICMRVRGTENLSNGGNVDLLWPSNPALIIIVTSALMNDQKL